MDPYQNEKRWYRYTVTGLKYKAHSSESVLDTEHMRVPVPLVAKIKSYLPTPQNLASRVVSSALHSPSYTQKI